MGVSNDSAEKWTFTNKQIMNVTLLKKDGKKEVINRVELAAMANAIKTGLIVYGYCLVFPKGL